MVKPEQMEITFKVNVTAPLMLTQKFLPHLKKYVEAKHDCSIYGSLIVNMGSILGSIQNNKREGERKAKP